MKVEAPTDDRQSPRTDKRSSNRTDTAGPKGPALHVALRLVEDPDRINLRRAAGGGDARQQGDEAR